VLTAFVLPRFARHVRPSAAELLARAAAEG
jgi:hypothetical protein